MYRITEIFQTEQGEGGRTGEPSTFVRFTGCNLWNGRPESRGNGKGACASWCDTDFARGDSYATPAEVCNAMHKVWAAVYKKKVFIPEKRWCVITGGEPLLQLDELLVDQLHLEDWRIAVETNGTIACPFLSKLDWVCVSPKLLADGNSPDIQIEYGNELKMVLPGASPGWSQEQLLSLEASTNFSKYYVQPQDPISVTSVNVSYLVGSLASEEQTYALHRDSCSNFVDAHPPWQLSIQTHKIRGMR